MEPFQNLKACSIGDELKPEEAANEGDKEKWPDMSLEEEDLIERLHRLLGERWGLISGRLPNRKPEEVERYWRMKERMLETKQKAWRPVCVKAKPSLKLTMIESIQDVEASKQKSEKHEPEPGQYLGTKGCVWQHQGTKAGAPILTKPQLLAGGPAPCQRQSELPNGVVPESAAERDGNVSKQTPKES